MIKPGIALVNIFYPVGSYYETSDNQFDPNNAWGGTWELDLSGTVLVSKSSSSSSKFNANVGNIIGEEDHKLTEIELPEINPQTVLSAGVDTGLGNRVVNTSWTWSNMSQTVYGNILKFGGNQKHNNIQPSKIANRWHRIA